MRGRFRWPNTSHSIALLENTLPHALSPSRVHLCQPRPLPLRSHPSNPRSSLRYGSLIPRPPSPAQPSYLPQPNLLYERSSTRTSPDRQTSS